jgi:hypothetical protein
MTKFCLAALALFSCFHHGSPVPASTLMPIIRSPKRIPGTNRSKYRHASIVSPSANKRTTKCAHNTDGESNTMRKSVKSGINHIRCTLLGTNLGISANVQRVPITPFNIISDTSPKYSTSPTSSSMRCRPLRRIKNHDRAISVKNCMPKEIAGHSRNQS